MISNPTISQKIPKNPSNRWPLFVPSLNSSRFYRSKSATFKGACCFILILSYTRSGERVYAFPRQVGKVGKVRFLMFFLVTNAGSTPAFSFDLMKGGAVNKEPLIKWMEKYRNKRLNTYGERTAAMDEGIKLLNHFLYLPEGYKKNQKGESYDKAGTFGLVQEEGLGLC